MRRSRSKVYRKKSSRRTTRWLRSWMAWRDSSWRPSLFGWLGESTGQALGNFQTPSWLVVTWTKPAEETSSQTLSLSLSLSSLSHRRLTARPSPSIFFIRRCHFNFFFFLTLSLSLQLRRGEKKSSCRHIQPSKKYLLKTNHVPRPLVLSWNVRISLPKRIPNLDSHLHASWRRLPPFFTFQNVGPVWRV